MDGIKNGKFIFPDGIITEGVLTFEDKFCGILPEEEAKKICDEIFDAEGQYVSPGFVDVHIHGYGGEDTSDGTVNGVRGIAEGILQNGVTAFCPTTMTVSLPEIHRALDVCRELKEESKTWNGAEILGVHAEGPCINTRKKGAQSEEFVLPPDIHIFESYRDILKLISLAPETVGALDFIKTVKSWGGITLSVGHTDALFEEAEAGIEAGMNHGTHLFNAMTGLNHRAPGAVGALLKHRDVYCELICDTFHIHPGLFSLIADIKKDHLVLITDCIRAGGLKDGHYTLGGQDVTVQGIECRLADGTIAGSVLKMNDAVKNLAEHTDLPIWEVINCASRNPAASIGAENKGTLETGKDADFLFLGDDFSVNAVFCRGEQRI